MAPPLKKSRIGQQRRIMQTGHAGRQPGGGAEAPTPQIRHAGCQTGPVILLGIGFTTRRLAPRILRRGVPVYAAVRDSGRFDDLAALGVQLRDLPHPDGLPQNGVLIHSVPPLPADESSVLRNFILQLAPRRIVYISSTGVYGNQPVVDENTATLASDDKARVRIEEEQWLQAGAWQSLIIRPAAIYGPGRGVHVRIREGRMPRSEPGGVTSRIHVDDLTAIVETGAFSDLTGAWPFADDYPCASAEVAAWFADIAGIDLNKEWREALPVWGRKVNGRKIRELLGVDLRYPRYDAGIRACLIEEEVLRQP
jgi:uncharacterized protein YbjT (DUF2867 family)